MKYNSTKELSELMVKFQRADIPLDILRNALLLITNSMSNIVRKSTDIDQLKKLLTKIKMGELNTLDCSDDELTLFEFNRGSVDYISKKLWPTPFTNNQTVGSLHINNSTHIEPDHTANTHIKATPEEQKNALPIDANIAYIKNIMHITSSHITNIYLKASKQYRSDFKTGLNVMFPNKNKSHKLIYDTAIAFEKEMEEKTQYSPQSPKSAS